MSHTTIVSSATFYVALLLLLVRLDFIQIEYVKIGVDNLHEIPKVNIYMCVQVLTLKMMVVIVFFSLSFAMCSCSHISLINSNDIIPVIFKIFGIVAHIFKKMAFVSAFHIFPVFICHHFSFVFSPDARTHTHTVSFFYSTKWKWQKAKPNVILYATKKNFHLLSIYLLCIHLMIIIIQRNEISWEC